MQLKRHISKESDFTPTHFCTHSVQWTCPINFHLVSNHFLYMYFEISSVLKFVDFHFLVKGKICMQSFFTSDDIGVNLRFMCI